jgi:hypothetical protein
MYARTSSASATLSGFENLEEGRASQRKLASLSFDAAGFGHGRPIVRDASARLRNKRCKKSRA